MSTATAAGLLRGAADAQSVITVTRTDGRIFTGTVREHPALPDWFALYTGQRGRPAFFHADDVESVVFE